MRAALAGFAVVLAATTACTAEPVDPRTPPVTTPPATAPPTSSSATDPTSAPAAAPRFDAVHALATVRELATGIGPRLATGPAYRKAVALLRPRLRSSGYAVTQQTFRVPAGDSWGVPAEAGRSANVVATPPNFDPTRPYAIVGAHLDTIADSPGAEDNASGVAVLMELARVLQADSALPIVLVLFGGEEPRGPGDLHHFGSKSYVAQMTGEERRNLVAMVSLDRVGVGRVVPLYAIDGGPTDVRDQLERAGERAGVSTVVGTNTGSDHESFADADLPAARVGGTSYAAYHSADDVPAVIDRAHLARVGRLLITWLTGLAGRTPGR